LAIACVRYCTHPLQALDPKGLLGGPLTDALLPHPAHAVPGGGDLASLAQW
jgi:hypothetical protein